MQIPLSSPRLSTGNDKSVSRRRAQCDAYLQPNGRAAVVVTSPLDAVHPRRLADLADIADRYAFEGLTAGSDGAIEVRGIDPEVISEVIEAIRATGAC